MYAMNARLFCCRAQIRIITPARASIYGSIFWPASNIWRFPPPQTTAAALYYLRADRIPVAVIPARTQNSIMSETLLDVKGMNCPLPVLRANRSLRAMAPGERLRVLATDRAAVADFQSFCRETGHALLAWSEENGVFSFVIRRRPEPAEPKDA